VGGCKTSVGAGSRELLDLLRQRCVVKASQVKREKGRIIETSMEAGTAQLNKPKRIMHV